MNISHGLERREREERDKVSEDIHQTLNLREREREWLWAWFIISNSTFVSQFNVNIYNIFKHYSALMPNSLWIIIIITPSLPLLLLLHR